MANQATVSHVVGGIRATLAASGCDAFWHVRRIGTEQEVGDGADELVVTASTFKVTVALELARQAAEGRIDLREPVRITDHERLVGTGLSSMLDEAEVSLRDLAFQMMALTDNTATDAIIARVGLDNINATVRSLGLQRTEILGDTRWILQTLAEDLGVTSDIGALRSSLGELADLSNRSDAELRRVRAFRPQTTVHSTPREMCELLDLIWTDKAGPPEACAEVRRLMALQYGPHRMRASYPVAEAAVAAKNGDLPGIQNEVGVIEFADGSQFAAGFYTRAERYTLWNPQIDAAIAESTRLAVDHLRGA